MKREIHALHATINDLLVNPNVPERAPSGGSGSRRPTSTTKVPTPAPTRGLAPAGSRGGRSSSARAEADARTSDNQVAVGNLTRNDWDSRSGAVRHGVGVKPEDPLRTAAMKKGSRVAGNMMGSTAAETAVAVGTSRQDPQDMTRSLPIMSNSMGLPPPTTTTTTTGGVTGDAVQFPKRVKTEDWIASAGASCGIAGGTHVSHGVDRLGFGGYNTIPQVRGNRSPATNSFMQTAAPSLPPRPPGVARRPNSVVLGGAFEESARVLDARWPTSGNVTHSRDSLRFDRSVQSVPGSRNTWPSVGRARLGCPSTETIFSSDYVTSMPGPVQREGGRFQTHQLRPVPRVISDEREMDGFSSTLDDQAEAHLDDCGLLALVLKIPQACDSGEGTSSSSWGALSGGSYLNTDEAFAAFATTTAEDVAQGER